MKKIGTLRDAFVIEGRGLAITTDREAEVADAMRFKTGDRLVQEHPLLRATGPRSCIHALVHFLDRHSASPEAAFIARRSAICSR